MPRVLALLAVLEFSGLQRAPVRTLVDLVESSLLEQIEVFLLFLLDESLAHEVFAEPSTATITEAVCVVSWGAVGNTLGGSGVDIAQCMSDTLELVWIESNLVCQDEVVG